MHKGAGLGYLILLKISSRIWKSEHLNWIKKVKMNWRITVTLHNKIDLSRILELGKKLVCSFEDHSELFGISY
jgi:hypothetical protein